MPSVSAVLDALAKPAIAFWQAKVVAEAAYDQRDYWTDLDREPAIGWLKGAGYRGAKKAADRGSAVHLAIETGDWSQVEAYRPAFEEFVRVHGKVTVVARERVVWTDRYAGRLDAVIENDHGLILVDWKTTGAVRASTELQCAAYVAAWNRGANPFVDQAAVVRMTDGGVYEWVHYGLPVLQAAEATFMSLLAVQVWQVRKGELKGATDIVDVTE